MSYDLAVWEGDEPADDADACSTFDELYERYLESEDVDQPPNPRIRAYVEVLVERFPDDADDSAWALQPVIDEASGPIVYLNLVRSRADEVSEYAAQLARAHRLVCLDLQSESVLSGYQGST